MSSSVAQSYLPPRLAGPDDIDVLIRHRAEMFAAMGVPRDQHFAAMVAASREWFLDALRRGRYLGWLVATARDPHAIVAGAGMLLLDWPPGLHDAGTTRAYILNVYVEPEHRRRGLARAVTVAAIDEARRRGIRVVTLHASEAGRPLYEQLGFVRNNEMRLLTS